MRARLRPASGTGAADRVAREAARRASQRLAGDAPAERLHGVAVETARAQGEPVQLTVDRDEVEPEAVRGSLQAEGRVGAAGSDRAATARWVNSSVS